MIICRKESIHQSAVTTTAVVQPWYSRTTAVVHPPNISVANDSSSFAMRLCCAIPPNSLCKCSPQVSAPSRVRTWQRCWSPPWTTHPPRGRWGGSSRCDEWMCLPRAFMCVWMCGCVDGCAYHGIHSFMYVPQSRIFSTRLNYPMDDTAMYSLCI